MHIRDIRHRRDGTIHCDEVPRYFGCPHPEFISNHLTYRELYMKSGQGFLLVFSITSLSSLTELYELRDQIVRIKDDSTIPLVIVGNKSDLEDQRAVSRSRAFGVSQSWNNAPYYETSARIRANVDEAFVDLCRQIIRKETATKQIRDMEKGVPRPRGEFPRQRPRRPKTRRRLKEETGKVCNIF